MVEYAFPRPAWDRDRSRRRDRTTLTLTLFGIPITIDVCDIPDDRVGMVPDRQPNESKADYLRRLERRGVTVINVKPETGGT